MKNANTSLIVANAIIWAALMIATSLLFKDHPNASMLVLLMIAGWLTTQGLIQKATGAQLATAADEIRCIKNLFNNKH